MKPSYNFDKIKLQNLALFFKNKYRWAVWGVFGFTLVGFSFQNCAPTKFSMDYQTVLNQLEQASEVPLVIINKGLPSNKKKNSVEVNQSRIEAKLDNTIVKMRFTYGDQDIRQMPWIDFAVAFDSDLEKNYEPDGSKDGYKKLNIEFLLQKENKIINVDAGLLLDTTPPQLTYFSIENGAKETFKNFTVSNLKIEDSASKIVRACVKNDAAFPGEVNSCWIPVSTLGARPENTVTLDNVPVILGFLQGDYTLYAFAQDEAGNMSRLSAQNAGTNLRDKKSITYNPPIPPVVTNVFATANDANTYPPTLDQLKLRKGEDLIVKWKIVSTYPLAANPISLYLTYDESSYRLLSENLFNKSNGNCTTDSDTSGCLIIKNTDFNESYFRLRVVVKDSNGQVAMGSSLPVNTGNFQVLAGNTDPGLMGSATAAIFFNQLSTNNYVHDEQSFLITDKGQILFRDIQRGLLIAEPSDGLLKVLIPYGANMADGPLKQANIKSVSAKIALDFQGKVLLSDENLLRRIDLETGEIKTLIGGGTKLEHKTKAKDFNFSLCSLCTLTPMPNGDILFANGSDFNRTMGTPGGARLRRYVAAEDSVHAYLPEGIGSDSDTNFDIQGSEYVFQDWVAGYDSVTSELNTVQIMMGKPVVGGVVFYYVTVDPKTFRALEQSKQLPRSFGAGYYSDSYTVDRAGQIYAFSRLEGALKKLDVVNKKWNTILGSGTLGQCRDKVAVTACSVDIQDIFIGLQGRIFFMDRGRVRVINNDNTALTIAGQSYSFGDESKAASARFGLIQFIDLDKSGRIVALDSTENRIRSFAPLGTINSLAGNGSNGGQSSTLPAKDNPIYTSYWGGTTSMVVDKLTNDILIGSNSTIVRLDSSTGYWSKIVGGGGQSYLSADGFAGLETAMGYPPYILGFNGSKLLLATNLWDASNGGFHYGSAFKLYDAGNAYTQSHLAGNLLATNDGDFSNGTLLSNSNVPTPFSSRYAMADYDAKSQNWLVGLSSTAKIVKMKEGKDERLTTWVNLPRPYNSFVRALTGSVGAEVEFVYYCALYDGRIYKYNVSTQVETALAWPTATMRCSGRSLKYDPVKKSVIFPFVQNSLNGIAEILD